MVYKFLNFNIYLICIYKKKFKEEIIQLKIIYKKFIILKNKMKIDNKHNWINLTSYKKTEILKYI